MSDANKNDSRGKCGSLFVGVITGYFHEHHSIFEECNAMCKTIVSCCQHEFANNMLGGCGAWFSQRIGDSIGKFEQLLGGVVMGYFRELYI